MKSLLVCVSVSHGNTLKVAHSMAEVLGAAVVEPEDVDPASIGDLDLVGFGSGIYLMRFHPRLYELVGRLPAVQGTPAFVFATSGSRELPLWSYTRPLAQKLRGKGFDVQGTFSCRGWDTVGPLGLIGGLNRGHPDAADLRRARELAAGLAGRLEAPRKAARSTRRP